MSDIDKIKEEIKKNVIWGQRIPPVKGGQTCGMPHIPITLRSEELDLEIVIGHYRSNLKNKQLAYILFELALDDIYF